MMLRFLFHLLLIVVSRFFSAVLRFSFLRSGLVQTTVIFQKPFALTREIIATEISRWPTHAEFSTTREEFLTTRWVLYCHSFTRLYKPRGSRVKSLFPGKSLVCVFLWEVTITGGIVRLHLPCAAVLLTGLSSGLSTIIYFTGHWPSLAPTFAGVSSLQAVWHRLPAEIPLTPGHSLSSFLASLLPVGGEFTCVCSLSSTIWHPLSEPVLPR